VGRCSELKRGKMQLTVLKLSLLHARHTCPPPCVVELQAGPLPFQAARSHAPQCQPPVAAGVRSQRAPRLRLLPAVFSSSPAQTSGELAARLSAAWLEELAACQQWQRLREGGPRPWTSLVLEAWA